ncbi:DUF1444 family protein [Chloroflexia bacterium SDU3-3]|nr:DUF1444 family protein [Chloroflexia bacterium SDU3-3]
MEADDVIGVMDAEQFATYLEKRLTLFDEIVPLYREGMQMRLSVADEPVECDLQPFFEAYQKRPELLDAIVQTLVRVIQGEQRPSGESDYTTLADRIFPMLKRVDLLVGVRERNLPMLAYRDFLADLIITYVVEEQGGVTYINEEHLERWDVNVQDLHEQAVENLRRRTGEISAVSSGQAEQRLFIFNSGDGYDATRMLLFDLLESWAQHTPGNLVIGIPNRDFLIAFSDADPDILSNIAIQIQSDSAQRQHGLTDQLFTLSGGQVRAYEWE